MRRPGHQLEQKDVDKSLVEVLHAETVEQVVGSCRNTCTACDPGGGPPAAALGIFNMSMDPWERKDAAPQGWAIHLHYQFKDTFSYDSMTLSSPLEVAQRQVLGQRTDLLIHKQRPRNAVEKRRHR